MTYLVAPIVRGGELLDVTSIGGNTREPGAYVRREVDVAVGAPTRIGTGGPIRGHYLQRASPDMKLTKSAVGEEADPFTVRRKKRCSGAFRPWNRLRLERR